jgi:hypothetical protein
MKKSLLLASISLFTLSAHSTFAMQKEAPKTFMDRAPQEIRAEIFKFLDTDEQSIILNMRKLYASSSNAQTNVALTKTILKYLIEKYKFNGLQFQGVANDLVATEFPIFQHPEVTSFIEEERKRLHLETHLRNAAFAGDIQTIKELINEGININATNDDGTTALFNALFYSNDTNYEIVLLLLKHGADPDIKKIQSNLSLLHCATSFHSLKRVQILLGAKANPNVLDYSNQTPLIYCLMHSDLLVITELLQAGANPNLGRIESGNEKYSPLKYVRKKLKNEELEKLLIQYGAHE